MGLLTDSSAAALATDPSVATTSLQSSGKAGQSSLPTAIFPSSATKIKSDSSADSKVTSSPTALSSSFYSNLQILTDTSSIDALASASGSISNSQHKSASSPSNSGSSGNNNGGLDEDGSGVSSSSVASVSDHQKSDTSGGSSIIYHYNQDKLNWKLIAIPIMLVLPIVL